MVEKRSGTLLASMERIETFTLNRVWTDLVDAELFWEPVEGAWGVRRREDCRTETPFGDGDWVADFGRGVEPPTTIGWQLWHIGSTPGRLAEIDFLGGSHTIASGWTSPYLTHHPVFATAADATETLRAGWTALLESVRVATDDSLERPTARYTYAEEPLRDGLAVLGPPGPELPGYVFVTSVLHEVAHHGAQICLLRDLYPRTRRGG